ncbi:MAG TPA: indole-3-glycerol phosphate synthase TrpC [Terriglobales bacterium]
MPTTLDQIIARTRIITEERKNNANMRALEAAAERHKPRGFRAKLVETSAKLPAIIAELKKASPSRGVIRKDFDVHDLARQLEQTGAAALSVLTNEDHFQGSLDYLRIASSSTSIPCLRKDFIVDEFQVLEARASCADAILLIVAALTDDELRELNSATRRMTLDVLCEVHDEKELARALDLGFDMIGVNNRDLRTFNVSLETAFRLAAKVPHSVTRVAESGIHTGAQMRELREAGYHAFLIGESLMKETHPGQALANLLADAGRAEIAKMPKRPA